MRLRKEKAIVTIYDAVSILKGFNVVNGSLTQNYYAESATYVPNRYIIPLVLRPKIDVSDPNNVIENGDKVDELTRLEWFENGVKINSNDDFKIEGANLTIFKNSEEPFELSYRAEWFDTRKKQVITIEDSVVVSCISLAQSDANTTISLSKPQNWVHNPLKGEHIYTINAYVSKDKVHESAVEWYYVDSNKNDVLIDETCNFYVGGQYTNALKVDSAYMDNVIIKAKNISNDKLKEIYWFFDKEGNPITYSEPDKTIIEGSNDFSLPESPITSKLDYKIEGLTLQNLIKNGKGEFKLTDSVISNRGIKLYDKSVYYIKCNIVNIDESASIGLRIQDKFIKDVDIKNNTTSDYFVSNEDAENKNVGYFSVSEEKPIISELVLVNLTSTFGAGNEPTKEWCDEHITGYFEGTKSVTAPMRIKSEIGGRNYVRNSRNFTTTSYWNAYHAISSINIVDGNLVIKTNDTLLDPRVFILTTMPTPPLNETAFFYVCIIHKNDEEVASLDNKNRRELEDRGSEGKTMSRELIEKKVEKTIYSGYVKSTFIYKVTNTIEYLGYINIGVRIPKNSVLTVKEAYMGLGNKPTDWSPAPEDNQPATGSTLYINNNIELKSVGTVKDYIENGKLYKNISDDGQILEQPEIVNLSTEGNLTTYPNGTIFIEPATLVEQQYSDGLQVDLPVKSLTSIKVGAEYLDVSKAVVKDNLITHPELENGDFVTVEYIYDDSPIYGDNSISYLSLEEILDDLWLDNVYTYKVTNGEWELVKITDIEDYEEWLKTEKTSPYTLAPDGVIFGSYEAETKFIRQYPSSLYVDIIAPTRLKQGITKIKARVLVGTRDGVVENPSNYFHFVWYRKENQAGAVETIIGHGEEIEIDIKEKDMIGVELQSLGVLSDTKTGDDRTLTDDENRKITLR